MRIDGKRQRKAWSISPFSLEGVGDAIRLCVVWQRSVQLLLMSIVLHYGYIWGPSQRSLSKIFGFAFFRIQLKTAVKLRSVQDVLSTYICRHVAHGPDSVHSQRAETDIKGSQAVQ